MNASARPPRVLHVVSRLAYYGSATLVRELANAQADLGLAVAVMTMYPSPPAAQPERFTRLAIDRRSGERWFFWRMLCAMRSWQPDVVHTHVHNGKYWGRAAALAAGVPAIVHTEHNSEFGGSLAARVANRLLEPFTDAFVGFSQTHAAALARAEGIPARKLAIVPNGLGAGTSFAGREEARERLGAGAHEFAIVQVARLEPVKEHRLALDAFAALARRHAQAKLYFVGEGECEAALRAQCDALRLGSRVRFLGFRSDVSALLPGADAALLTSRNEAMPMAIIEAMLAGVPVVTTPWRGASEMLQAGVLGAIARAHDASAIAAALEGIMRDPQAAARTAQRAQSHARTAYAIGTTAQAYLELYRSLRGNTPSAPRRGVMPEPAR